MAKRPIRVYLLWLAVTASLVAAPFAYGLGFAVGFFARAGIESSSEAAFVTNALRLFRSGTTDESLQSVEAILDRRILDRWSYDRDRTFSWLPIPYFDDPAAPNKLLQFAADYRQVHPTNAEDEGVRKSVAEFVEKYRSR